MSEKKHYEKPVLVNCGTMVEQTECIDGGVSNSFMQPPRHVKPPHHGRGW